MPRGLSDCEGCLLRRFRQSMCKPRKTRKVVKQGANTGQCSVSKQLQLKSTLKPSLLLVWQKLLAGKSVLQKCNAREASKRLVRFLQLQRRALQLCIAMCHIVLRRPITEIQTAVCAVRCAFFFFFPFCHFQRIPISRQSMSHPPIFTTCAAFFGWAFCTVLCKSLAWQVANYERYLSLFPNYAYKNMKSCVLFSLFLFACKGVSDLQYQFFIPSVYCRPWRSRQEQYKRTRSNCTCSRVAWDLHGYIEM